VGADVVAPALPSDAGEDISCKCGSGNYAAMAQQFDSAVRKIRTWAERPKQKI